MWTAYHVTLRDDLAPRVWLLRIRVSRFYLILAANPICIAALKSLFDSTRQPNYLPHSIQRFGFTENAISLPFNPSTIIRPESHFTYQGSCMT